MSNPVLAQFRYFFLAKTRRTQRIIDLDMSLRSLRLCAIIFIQIEPVPLIQHISNLPGFGLSCHFLKISLLECADPQGSESVIIASSEVIESAREAAASVAVARAEASASNIADPADVGTASTAAAFGVASVTAFGHSECFEVPYILIQQFDMLHIFTSFLPVSKGTTFRYSFSLRTCKESRLLIRCEHGIGMNCCRINLSFRCQDGLRRSHYIQLR